jgi:hypothetical protein
VSWHAGRSGSDLVYCAMYQVWFSIGRGFQPGPKFRLLEDARRHVVAHCHDASWAIQAPDGSWCEHRRRTPSTYRRELFGG